MSYERESLKKLSQEDFIVDRLGERLVDSPIEFPENYHSVKNEKVLFNTRIDFNKPDWQNNLFTFETPIPNDKIYFHPSKVNVGIVTCGGLCPGLNDVIRAITYSSLATYKIKNVYGFRYGYLGLTKAKQDTVISLTSKLVDSIHEHGGTMLGSSRGNQDIEDMVDTLVKFNISILFTVGGDGTQSGAMAMANEIKRRNLSISVIGIPKTIDNDIPFIDKTFGFETAVEEARKAIDAAHVEAKGAMNGIGIVKLMGRHSGFIATHATLASGNANICLIPEDKISVEEINQKVSERFLKGKDHIVIVIAEGFGQELLYTNKEKEFDASGNLKLIDIGPYLKNQIAAHLNSLNIQHTIKYIDPSYLIRSKPAIASDSSFCLRLSNYAVHAGMSGYTNCLIGYWGSNFTMVPIKLSLSSRKRVDIQSSIWQCVKEITL